MTLTDAREALADHSSFIGYLIGLAAVARMIRTLADDAGPTAALHDDPDDFVYALLGLASLGSGIERLAKCPPLQQCSVEQPVTRWLQ
ncbi:hypothetical protein [Mycobacterium simiae]|uniref:Uncharacterized protein n=1 Tax=Mycobacterium simiae TaxID=1784 RepID=A0A1X0XWS5_MYCSI|nr:hypothetical protein [Mycobacterium simiae]ORJ57309.1 hypothetical protein B5M45_22375 [Mycobacterium simiae]